MNPSCYTALTSNQTVFKSQNKTAWDGFLNKVNSKLPGFVLAVITTLTSFGSTILALKNVA